jgi:hypothetical protein
MGIFSPQIERINADHQNPEKGAVVHALSYFCGYCKLLKLFCNGHLQSKISLRTDNY